MRNALKHAPTERIRKELVPELKEVFNASRREEAERYLRAPLKKYAKRAPKLSQWLEENIPDGFTVFRYPASQRKRLRSTNLCEYVKRRIRRRTKVVGVFPNEKSLLRLATSICMEISEEWETGKIYLPKAQN